MSAEDSRCLRFDELFLQREGGEIVHSAKVFVKKHSEIA